MINLIEVGAPRTTVSQNTYRNLFTFDERCAIRAHTNTTIPVQVLVDDLSATQFVDLKDDRVAFGLAYLVSLGIISYPRMQEILSYRE